MTTTTTINGLIKLAKEECTQMAKLNDVTYRPTIKTTIEFVLEMVITKSVNDHKMMELAVNDEPI